MRCYEGIVRSSYNRRNKVTELLKIIYSKACSQMLPQHGPFAAHEGITSSVDKHPLGATTATDTRTHQGALHVDGLWVS